MNANPQTNLLPIEFHEVGLKKSGRVILNQLNLVYPPQDVQAGITILMGANGAGKSFCLQLMAGLEQPDHGKISWGGRNLNEKQRRYIGLVLQKPVMLRRKVIANLIFGYRLMGISQAMAQELALQCLETHRLDHLAEQYRLRGQAALSTLATICGTTIMFSVMLLLAIVIVRMGMQYIGILSNPMG